MTQPIRKCRLGHGVSKLKGKEEKNMFVICLCFAWALWASLYHSRVGDGGDHCGRLAFTMCKTADRCAFWQDKNTCCSRSGANIPEYKVKCCKLPILYEAADSG